MKSRVARVYGVYARYGLLILLDNLDGTHSLISRPRDDWPEDLQPGLCYGDWSMQSSDFREILVGYLANDGEWVRSRDPTWCGCSPDGKCHSLDYIEEWLASAALLEAAL